MRFALWLAGLFATAVALALFASNNQATVTLFWPPHRVDVSLNLLLLLTLVLFVVLHLALRALSAMLSIPQQARRWRLLHKERSIQAALLESMSHLMGGRFIRARKAAELVATLEESVSAGGEALPYAARLRALSHLLAAESAHALQDRNLRESHFQQALKHSAGRDALDTRDAVQLRAARWALEDRDAVKTMEWLEQLPQGAARRTVALRLRFKAARMAGRSLQALETARLLTKHRAFSAAAGSSIARGLAIEHLESAHDPAQMQRAWAQLDPSEQKMPDVAMHAADRLQELGGDPQVARQWLLPAWDALRTGTTLNGPQRVRLVRILEGGFAGASQVPDTEWLSRIESAQLAQPGDPVLQYLAGVVCMRLKLWGKAQLLLRQSLATQQDTGLKQEAWRALAHMAEERGDTASATQAYRQALG